MERSLRLGAFLLVLISAVALFLTYKLQISSLILIGVTLIAWFYNPRSSKTFFWEIASLAYLLFFFVDLFRISGSLAPALVHLFIFILINKIFNLNAARDFYHLYLLTFLSMLAASSLSVEIEMFYMILIYILLFVWNIVSITLYQEWRREKQDGPPPFSLFSPLYWMFVVAMSMVTFVIALGIFFVVPRMQLGYFSGNRSTRLEHVSGFSQKVELGDISNIQDNTGVAMRVHVEGVKSPTVHLYWRGIAFDHYDGKSWSASNAGTRFLYEDSDNLYYNSHATEDLKTLLRQEFYLQPMDTRVVFGADRIVRLNGLFGAVSKDLNGTLTGMSKPLNYTVYSRVPIVNREHLRATGDTEIPENIQRYYLQLPFRTAQMSRLVNQIVSSQKTTVDQVFAVKEYLERNYKYTTTDLPLDAKDPVSAFLFDRKVGDCEFFATSMALLLRYAGIPSRVVNGFLEGEYNELGDFYLVRQTDAHSWVEAYVGGLWLPFDPSPRPIGGEKRFFIDFRKLFDSISYFWDRYILIYSAEDQIDTVTSLRDRYLEVEKKVQTISDQNQGIVSRLNNWFRSNHALVLLMLSSALLLYVAMKYLVRARKRSRVSRTPILFYQEMLSILERKGFVREPQITPTEFLQNIQSDLPENYNEDIDRVTNLFYRARFGNYPLTPHEQNSVRSSLARLEQL